MSLVPVGAQIGHHDGNEQMLQEMAGKRRTGQQRLVYCCENFEVLRKLRGQQNFQKCSAPNFVLSASYLVWHSQYQGTSCLLLRTNPSPQSLLSCSIPEVRQHALPETPKWRAWKIGEALGRDTGSVRDTVALRFQAAKVRQFVSVYQQPQAGVHD